MKEIDVHYWMQGVKFGQYRGRIILELLDLKDAAYQEREWVKGGEDDFFVANISFSCDMFFEELSLQDYFDNKEFLYNWIGEIFKSEEEVDALQAAAVILYKLYRSCHYDVEFFTSPYLTPLREASAKAFDIFMANEKDNKEFCEFIAELQEKRKQQVAET